MGDLLGKGTAGTSDGDGTGLGGHGDPLGDDKGLDGRDVLHLFLILCIVECVKARMREKI